MGVFVRQDIGLHIAESAFWFVFSPVIKSLDDIFFETGRARIGRDYGIALRFCEFVIGDADNVHFDPAVTRAICGCMCTGTPGAVCNAIAGRGYVLRHPTEEEPIKVSA
jgi:hypothetical protein